VAGSGEIPKTEDNTLRMLVILAITRGSQVRTVGLLLQSGDACRHGRRDALVVGSPTWNLWNLWNFSAPYAGGLRVFGGAAKTVFPGALPAERFHSFHRFHVHQVTK
jgi:hypothetical protein